MQVQLREIAFSWRESGNPDPSFVSMGKLHDHNTCQLDAHFPKNDHRGLLLEPATIANKPKGLRRGMLNLYLRFPVSHWFMTLNATGWQAAYLRWLKKKREPRAPPPSVCNYIRAKASIWHAGVPVLNCSMCKHHRAQLGSISAATKCFICPQVSLIYLPLNTRVGSGILCWLRMWVDKSVHCGGTFTVSCYSPHRQRWLREIWWLNSEIQISKEACG